MIVASTRLVGAARLVIRNHRLSARRCKRIRSYGDHLCQLWLHLGVHIVRSTGQFDCQRQRKLPLEQAASPCEFVTAEIIHA